MDPAAYLAEVAQKGNIDLQLLHNGKDLLGKYKNADSTLHSALSPDEWMKKLLSPEDSGASLGYGADPVVEMAVTMFTSLMALALQIDDKEEPMKQVTEAALDKRIDLTTLFPSYKECVMEIRNGERPVLHIDAGSGRSSRELTAREMNPRGDEMA